MLRAAVGASQGGFRRARVNLPFACEPPTTRAFTPLPAKRQVPRLALTCKTVTSRSEAGNASRCVLRSAQFYSRS